MIRKDERKIVFLGVGIICLLFFYTIFSARGIMKGHQLTTQRDTIVSKNVILAAQNEKLSTDVNMLNSNLKTIEKAARNQLDLVRKNEILYKFID